jgi:hypothetical protein
MTKTELNIEVRQFISMNEQVSQKPRALEMKQMETDKKLNQFLAFFDGQVFNADMLVKKITKRAKKQLSSCR